MQNGCTRDPITGRRIKVKRSVHRKLLRQVQKVQPVQEQAQAVQEPVIPT